MLPPHDRGRGSQASGGGWVGAAGVAWLGGFINYIADHNRNEIDGQILSQGAPAPRIAYRIIMYNP